MRNFYTYLFVSLLGGFGYCFIEILWRGRTHYSMFFAGAVVLSTFYYISQNYNIPLWAKGIVGMIIITVLEFILGIIFNVILKENVWDYSNMPLNVMGQICLPFSAIWFVLSALAFISIEKAEHLLK